MVSKYKDQTASRDDLKEIFHQQMKDIIESMQGNPDIVSKDIYIEMYRLKEKLSYHKGKKMYGYLNKRTKKIVDSIVELMSKNKDISRLYDLWYKCQCRIFETYTDERPEKIPLQENKEFKSLKNTIIKMVDDMERLPEMPNLRMDYDYNYLIECSDNEDKLIALAENKDSTAMYRLGKYYLNNEYDKDEAEYWLKESCEKGNHFAMVELYQAWKEGRINISKGEAIKQLRKAVDKNIPFAEYEYYLVLRDKSGESALKYLNRAYNHGDFRAQYAMGKELFEKGKIKEALEIFEKASLNSDWCKTSLGLLYIYKLNDYKKGMTYLQELASEDYTPAISAIKAIKQKQNGEMAFGICNLFYHLGNIICDDADNTSDEGKSIMFIDRRTRKENQAKKQGITIKHNN